MSVPLGRPWAWRCGAGVALAVVVSTASVAQQRVVAVDPSIVLGAATPELAYAPVTIGTPVVTVELLPDVIQPAAAPIPEPETPSSRVPPVVAADVAIAAPARDGRSRLAPLRRDVDNARAAVNALERSLDAIDSSIADLTASMAAEAANAEAQRAALAAGSEHEALTRAQSAYNEAIARERRAATLAAHGVPARQELEESQVQVRDAAAALAAARRAADQLSAVAAAEALQARAQAEIALAQAQQRRAEHVTQLGEARRRLRDAEDALAAQAASE